MGKQQMRQEWFFATPDALHDSAEAGGCGLAAKRNDRHTAGRGG